MRVELGPRPDLVEAEVGLQLLPASGVKVASVAAAPPGLQKLPAAKRWLIRRVALSL